MYQKNFEEKSINTVKVYKNDKSNSKDTKPKFGMSPCYIGASMQENLSSGFLTK